MCLVCPVCEGRSEVWRFMRRALPVPRGLMPAYGEDELPRAFIDALRARGIDLGIAVCPACGGRGVVCGTSRRR